MRGLLGIGLIAGFVAAGWCLASGTSLFVAFLAYSAAGTVSTLLAAVVSAAAPEQEEADLVTE